MDISLITETMSLRRHSIQISNIYANYLHILNNNIIKNIYSKFKCKDCLLLLTKSSSSVFPPGSFRLML